MDPVEHDTDFVWKQSSGGRIPFGFLLKWGGFAAVVAIALWQLAPHAVPVVSQFAEALFQERNTTNAGDHAVSEPEPDDAGTSAAAVPDSMVDAPSGAATTPWAEVPTPGVGVAGSGSASEAASNEPLSQAASPIREVEPDSDTGSGQDSFSAEPTETAPSAAPDPAGKADGYWNGSSFN